MWTIASLHEVVYYMVGSISASPECSLPRAVITFTSIRHNYTTVYRSLELIYKSVWNPFMVVTAGLSHIKAVVLFAEEPQSLSQDLYLLRGRSCRGSLSSLGLIR